MLQVESIDVLLVNIFENYVERLDQRASQDETSIVSLATAHSSCQTLLLYCKNYCFPNSSAADSRIIVLCFFYTCQLRISMVLVLLLMLSRFEIYICK